MLLYLNISDNFLLLKNGEVIGQGDKKELLNSSDRIKKAGMEVPQIINFIK